MTTFDYQELLEQIRSQAKSLGFNDLRVSDLDTSQAIPELKAWLDKGHHGHMNYMIDSLHLREDPKKILPQALRLICVRMDYLPDRLFGQDEDWRINEWTKLNHPEYAVVSVYARGRDYHKVLRGRLQKLALFIEEKVSPMQYRVAVDSVPILEVEFAQKSGIGWRGKHTLAIHREAGSMFFLGEILVNLPLPVDPPISDHCGECTSCIEQCPTKAITGPYTLDARKCISYLTIEHQGSIPEELRLGIGNLIYGCDICQLACPWNKFAKPSLVGDFQERHELGSLSLFEVFEWSKQDFDNKLQGSAIYRIGYEQWMRNVAVGLGNLLRNKESTQSQKLQAKALLQEKLGQLGELVDEHIQWALNVD
jgi:epoxyqueuosine reductase